jgi:phage terminase small subunit
MKGRKPTDSGAKVLRGTFRADRDRPRARAREESAGLAPPEDFAPDELREWDKIVELMTKAGTLGPVYALTIEHLARLSARAAAMRRSIGRRYVLRTAKPAESGGKRGFLRNPALGQLLELEAAIVRLYQVLGLTPDSVLRAPKVGTDDKEDNEFAEFAG